jgi:hypothetical protein
VILSLENDPADRRRMILRLSRQGDALLLGAQETVRRHLAGLLGRVDEKSLAALAEALVVLQENFPSPGGESAPPGAATAPPASGGGRHLELHRREPSTRKQRVP